MKLTIIEPSNYIITKKYGDIKHVLVFPDRKEIYQECTKLGMFFKLPKYRITYYRVEGDQDEKAKLCKFTIAQIEKPEEINWIPEIEGFETRNSALVNKIKTEQL